MAERKERKSDEKDAFSLLRLDIMWALHDNYIGGNLSCFT